jgi:hypothetical protein
MADSSFRWFQALYDGLQLWEPENVEVTFGMERLGFFDDTRGHKARARSSFDATEGPGQCGLLATMERYVPKKNKKIKNYLLILNNFLGVVFKHF